MGKKNLKYQSPGINEGTRFEKLHTVSFDNSEIASNLIAREICDLVKLKQEKGKNCVLGFATGSSPTHIYKEIIRIHKEESISFKNVIAFNLDEYYPIKPNDKNSYYHFMNENLFDHLDIPKGNINIPSGFVITGETGDVIEAGGTIFTQGNIVNNGAGYPIQKTAFDKFSEVLNVPPVKYNPSGFEFNISNSGTEAIASQIANFNNFVKIGDILKWNNAADTVVRFNRIDKLAN